MLESRVVPTRSTGAVDALIGNTPLVEIRYRLDGRPGRIFAKYELENMTGSIKDRMAAHIVRRAFESGDLPAWSSSVSWRCGNDAAPHVPEGRRGTTRATRSSATTARTEGPAR